MKAQSVLLAAAAALMAAIATPGAAAEIEVRNLDAALQRDLSIPAGETATWVERIRGDGFEAGVLVMRENPLHHHAQQDHVLYVVRGNGLAKLENAAGQIERRAVKPGDILSLPRGKKHGFENVGPDDLVFLVISTPLPPGAEETTYHE